LHGNAPLAIVAASRLRFVIHRMPTGAVGLQHPTFNTRALRCPAPGTRTAIDAPLLIALANQKQPFARSVIAPIVNQTSQTVTQDGIGIGSVIAVVCSWQRNCSIRWAILAGVFSWIDIIHFAITRKIGESK
jgi:hypothetical protein